MGRKNKQKLPAEPVSATIRALSHDGRGIANIDGKTTFIRGALPNETVDFLYTRKRGSYDEGVIENVIIASENRATPPCEYFGTCGGCNFQHLKTDKQIEHKQAVFLEQLKAIGETAPTTLLPALTATTLGYRRKARLGVKYVIKKERVLVGFRELNGRYLANMENCQILHPKIGKHLGLFSALIASLDIYNAIAQIEVAVGDDQTALVFRHLKPINGTDLEKLTAFAEAHQFAIYLQPKGPDTIHKIYPKDNQPLLHYSLPSLNLEFAFHPTDFIQVNKAINEQMLTQALTLLDLKPTDVVLDLFCGLGNFSLPLAQKAKKVIGIEGDETMVKRATENALKNKCLNTEFHTANLFETDQPLLNQRVDKIVLDPPRAGAIEIIPLLCNISPELILYVSCNPATLARDTKALIENGYRLDKAGVMDMFPHTSHVEAMALFIKNR